MPLLTVKEAARELTVCEMTVRRLIWGRKLKSVRVGRGIRLRRETLNAWLLRKEA